MRPAMSLGELVELGQPVLTHPGPRRTPGPCAPARRSRRGARRCRAAARPDPCATARGGGPPRRGAQLLQPADAVAARCGKQTLRAPRRVRARRAVVAELVEHPVGGHLGGERVLRARPAPNRTRMTRPSRGSPLAVAERRRPEVVRSRRRDRCRPSRANSRAEAASAGRLLLDVERAHELAPTRAPRRAGRAGPRRGTRSPVSTARPSSNSVTSGTGRARRSAAEDLEQRAAQQPLEDLGLAAVLERLELDLAECRRTAPGPGRWDGRRHAPRRCAGAAQRAGGQRLVVAGREAHAHAGALVDLRRPRSARVNAASTSARKPGTTTAGSPSLLPGVASWRMTATSSATVSG
jgi:hypothetical protein